jgi:type I restriction enzyme S subunit
MSMPNPAEVAVLNFQVRDFFDVLHFGRRVGVIQNALNAAEAFGAHHLFAIQIAVGLAELRVAFVWNAAEFTIEGHGVPRLLLMADGISLIGSDYSTSFELANGKRTRRKFGSISETFAHIPNTFIEYNFSLHGIFIDRWGLAMQYARRMIGDLCSQDRTTVTPDSPMAKTLPFLGLEHVESVTGRILRESLSYNGSRNGTSFLFDTRHVLYCKLRPYLNKVAVPDFTGRCTTELIPLLPRENVSRDFLAWLLRKPQTVQAAMQERTGARMPRANMRHLLAQQVLIPESIQEQQHLADEMTRRMNLVVKTRLAYNEQIQLLDTYELKALFEFPFSSEINKNEVKR